MCGRTACTLAPDDVVKACGFRNRHGRRQLPVWKDAPGGQNYKPSHNVAPTCHTPVLLSSKHFPGELDSLSERVVQPMKWGLVPAWHKGDPYHLQFETNNCRAEGMLTKRTYKVPLEKGKRCVILADGFFEWLRTKEGKQPYFIYFPQDGADSKPDLKPDIKQEIKSESIKPDPDTKPTVKQEINSESVKPAPDQEPLSPSEASKWEAISIKQEQGIEPSGPTLFKESPPSLFEGKQDDEETEVWKGKRLLTMAGVFDVWSPPDGSPPLYSYSVITVDASPAMSFIHHRMPAILSTEEEVTDWLEFAEVPLSKAVKVIYPSEGVAMHMVSPVVNNSRNQSAECVAPYNPKEGKKTASSSLMMNWLSKARPSRPEQQTSTIPAKKFRLQ